ncbi:MAG: hypothetical protein Q8867_03035 [Bacteroidota bacterium]|nr:hypothetical protein [Bacteroidota bacterium]
MDYLMHPERLNAGSIEDFCDLTEHFPYFSAARILYAYNLFKEDDLDFPAQFRKAAAYAVDRNKLRLLFEGFHSRKSLFPGMEIVQPILDIPISEPELPEANELPETEELPVTADEVAPEMTTFPDVPAPEPTPEPAPEPTSEPTSALLSKDEIISRFIREEPRISTPKSEFFHPSETAQKSNVDSDEIVSETLAILYVKQGNVSRAINIYEKLILLFPEKRVYFAGQIEKLK